MNNQFGFVNVATGGFEVNLGNPNKNAEEIIKIIQKASQENIEVLVFSELSLTGYSCGDLFMQAGFIQSAETALNKILIEGKKFKIKTISVIGLPIRSRGMQFNVAAIIQGDRILGIVPKTHLPNYGEYSEKRWFSSASARMSDTIILCGQEVPFTPNIIIETPSAIRLACEICEDLWVPHSPSLNHALSGANIIVNLSASNETITKAHFRSDLVKIQSFKCKSAYLYASSGIGESTTDLIFSGHHIIAYNGLIIKEEKNTNGLFTSVIDLEKLEHDRIKFNSFAQETKLQENYKIVYALETCSEVTLPKYVDPAPFLPRTRSIQKISLEILQLQVQGLLQRLKKTKINKSIVGVSGGLDSTLALLVTVETHKALNLPLQDIIGITMPGMGTSKQTKNNALDLMNLLGVSIKEIDISAACLQHLIDIGHQENAYDVTYENVQARERMQILMDIANQENAIVVGTSNLSELALGWTTYNGDHMSMYNVNVGIPKTIIPHVITTYGEKYHSIKDILSKISNTTISPELLPIISEGEIQSTEKIIGRYELHDFFLYHFMKNGFTKEKIRTLAYIAFGLNRSNEIDQALNTFFNRFYNQQFKRSCLPDGPKILDISLSPRSDWKMPSDMPYFEENF